MRGRRWKGGARGGLLRKWRRTRGDDENRNEKPRQIAAGRRKGVPEKKRTDRCNANRNRSDKMKEKVEEAEEGS